MDKNTLSNYGWIVICCLVLVVMIALATPFGKFVGAGFKSSYEGFNSVTDKALGVVGISTGNGSGAGTEDPAEPESKNIIPEGGQVVLGETTYNAGEEFPANEDGMKFTYGDYKYTYYSSINGWGVELNEEVTDRNQTEYGEILESINDASVLYMNSTFSDCKSLTIVPTIPSGVTDMTGTFWGCTALTTAPIIPESVTDMAVTFWGCTSLEVAPVIPDSVTDMEGTFEGCTSLTTAPTIPNGVTDMSRTFNSCENLTTAPTIPNSVIYMEQTFADCTSLTTAPVIPNGVESMRSTFEGCASLETAPVIPSGVTNMNSTFNGCAFLTGEVEINANNLKKYDECFYNTTLPITLTGTSPYLNDIASQYSNVSVQ